MKPFEHGGNVHCAGEIGRWLDFSANINPLGLSEVVSEALHNEIKSLVHYPDPLGQDLKQAISGYYGLNPEGIVLGNGAAELMYVLFHTLRPQKVLIPVPSFSEYERSALAAECQVDYLYLKENDGFKIDFTMLEQLAVDYDAVILGNPNNPTGELIQVEVLEHFLEMVQNAGTMLIMDESFLDFRTDSSKYSAKALLGHMNNLFIIHSLTKFYAIPGLRLGFGVGNTELIARLELAKDPWNVNLLAQRAGVVALKDKDYQQESRSLLIKMQLEFITQLKAIHCLKVYEASVNFVLVNIKNTGLTSGLIVRRMRMMGILIRDCSNYPGLDEGYIRLAIRNHNENDQVIKAMRSVLGIDIVE